MTGRKPATIPIASLCAVPFLLSLFAYACVSFMASMAGSFDQDGAKKRMAEQANRDGLLREIGGLQRRLKGIREHGQEQAELSGRAQQAAARAKELRMAVMITRSHVASLEAELSRLQALERQVAEKRRSKEDTAKETDAARQQIAELEKEISELQAQLNRLEKKAQNPKDPIVGSGRDSVYVECSSDGAKIMPDGIRLGAVPAPGDQETFITKARQKGLVFFLVRPSGFAVFQTYRAITEAEKTARKDRRIDVGFEPVDEDAKLKYEKVGDYHIIEVE